MIISRFFTGVGLNNNAFPVNPGLFAAALIQGRLFGNLQNQNQDQVRNAYH